MDNSVYDKKVVLIGVGGAGVNTAKRISGYKRVAIDVQEEAVNWGDIEHVIPIKSWELAGVTALSTASIASINASIEASAAVVICAGLSGNTGSELAPVVAELAKQQGKLLIAIVFKPFLFEGGSRRARADASAVEMQQIADCTICISNDKLKNVGRGITFADTLAVTDSVIVEVLEIISKHIERATNIAQPFAVESIASTNRKCPVCMSSVEARAAACAICGFDQLGYVAINREEAEIWFNETVIPARQSWEQKQLTSTNFSDIKEAIALRMSAYQFVESVT